MNLNKVLRVIAIGGVFLLPLIPIYVAKTMFFPFITGKNFAFRIIAEIVFASWLILAIRSPEYRLKKSFLLWAVSIFTVVVFLTDMLGVHVFKSIWSNFERMEGLFTILHLFAYFLAAAAILNTEKLWKWFWHISIAVSVYLGIYGIFQLAGLKPINQGGVRLDATFGNATYLAIYMVFHLFLTAMYFFRHCAKNIGRKKGLFIKFGYTAIIILQFFTLYHTATRGALLGLVGGVIITAVLLAIFGRGIGVLRKYAIGAFVGVIVMAGLFVAIKNTRFVRESQVLSRFASLSLSEGASRFRVWSMGVHGFKERPLLGWGQGNFDIVFNKYYNPDMFTQEPWFDRAHNIVFDWLIAGGVLGLAAYLSMFAASLYVLWRSPEEAFSVVDKSLLTGLFCAYFFHNLFVFDNITSYLPFFSVLAFIHSTSYFVLSSDGENITKHSLSKLRAGRNGATLNRASGSQMADVLVPIVIAALLFSLYGLNIRGIRASRQLISAISPQGGGAAENLKFFRKAIASSPIGRIEAREQLIQFAIQAVASKQVANDLKLEIASTAESEMLRQLEAMPRSARHYFFLGSFYRRLGQQDKAIDTFSKALELSPQKQQIAFELALSYLDKGENNKALGILRKSYEDEPRFAEAQTLYALGAIYSGENDLADNLLVDQFGTTAPDNSRVLKAYFDTKQFDRVVAIWKARVDKDSENAQLHLSLGAAYAASGSREEAIDEINKAIKLRPDFREKGEKLIRDIKAGRGEAK